MADKTEKKVETRVVMDRFDKRAKCMAHQREQFEERARMAIDFVCRWGAVAGFPNGEDSAGRQKLRLMTPAELVARACSCADLLVGEAEKRGWATLLPSLEEITAFEEGDKEEE